VQSMQNMQLLNALNVYIHMQT